MKPTGRHPEKALTPARIRTLSKPGRYADGNGLYLIVDSSGSKQWMLRTVVHGRRREIGLGGLKLVSLAEARDKATQYRKLARDGGDPLAERRRTQTIIPSFEEAARTVHEEHSGAWKNAKHSAQWISSLSEYAFPVIGKQRIDYVDTPDSLRVLPPFWLTKPETARRVKQRIGTIFGLGEGVRFQGRGESERRCHERFTPATR